MNALETMANQTEIARLNQIITVLLEQNSVLKAELSYAKSVMGQITSAKSMSEIMNGLTESSKSIAHLCDGTTETDKSITKTGSGITGTGKSIYEIVYGFASSVISNAKTEVGSTTGLKPLPSILPSDGSFYLHLENTLHINGVRHLTKAARINVATLLIHFYNKSRSDYTELRKLTGYSHGGMSKFMTALRKRGLIENTGWQKYAPTAHALQLMQKALG